MLKLILIFALVAYVIYKVASFFFRAGAATRQFRDQQRNGGVNGPGNRKQGSRFKGGEYVDYEEVDTRK